MDEEKWEGELLQTNGNMCTIRSKQLIFCQIPTYELFTMNL